MARPPRPVVFVALATAFSLLGDQTLYAVLPSYYETLHLMPLQVGILLSVNRWVRLITNHFAERLLARFNTAGLLTAALIVGALLTAVYGTFTVFPFLLGARIVWGLCWSFIRQSGWMTAAETSPPVMIGQVMGYYNGLSRLGSLAGNLLGAIGHDVLGFSRTLILFSATSLLATPLGAASQRNLPRHGPLPSRKAGPFRHTVGLWVCGFIAGSVGAGLIMSTLGLVLKEQVGEGVVVVGIPIGVATLTGILLSSRWITDGLGSPLLGALSDRLGRRRAAPLFFGLGSVVLFSGAWVSGPISLVLLVFAFFVCGTAVAVTVAAEAAHRGPRVTAAYVTAADLGSATGPILGWTIHQIGLPIGMIFLLGGGLYLVGAFASARSLSRRILSS